MYRKTKQIHAAIFLMACVTAGKTIIIALVRVWYCCYFFASATQNYRRFATTRSISLRRDRLLGRLKTTINDLEPSLGKQTYHYQPRQPHDLIGYGSRKLPKSIVPAPARVCRKHFKIVIYYVWCVYMIDNLLHIVKRQNNHKPTPSVKDTGHLW